MYIHVLQRKEQILGVSFDARVEVQMVRGIDLNLSFMGFLIIGVHRGGQYVPPEAGQLS